MSKRKPISTFVERLMLAMDACARARGEAQWMNGYRARNQSDITEDTRLHKKEKAQWAIVGRQDALFRRTAQRILRGVSQ